MIKWVLLMIVFLPDGSHVNLQSTEPLPSEKACERKAEEMDAISKKNGAVVTRHVCEPSLPGEEA